MIKFDVSNTGQESLPINPLTGEPQAWGSASERQLAFIGSLMGQVEYNSPTHEQNFCHRYGELASAGELNKAKASEIITYLLTLPRKSVTTNPAEVNAQASRETMTATSDRRSGKGWHDVPDGRYALRMPEDTVNPIHFYTINTGKDGGRWEGFRFVNRHVSDERYPVKGEKRTEVLDRIEQNPREAAVLYGHETNHCCLCNRELTRPESREAGIGPVCADKAGW